MRVARCVARRSLPLLCVVPLVPLVPLMALVALVALAPLVAQSATSQPREAVASVADIAIAQGRLGDAEEALFAASSRAPHEPSARGALGIFLASRGRLKVGAVLLDEARRFGGDAGVIDAHLARIYAWLGDWSAVAALQHAPMSAVERDRVKWLAVNAPARSGPDSVVVALEPNEAAGFGRIALAIGGVTLLADIDPNIEGLVLPSTPEVAGEAQQFGMRDSASVAAIYSVGIGGIRLTNVSANLSPSASPAIGLGVLAALVPTFDAGAHSLTLHQQAAPAPGDALPILLAFPGVKFVARAGQPPVPMESAAGRAALRGTRWTFDVRRGAILVQR
jgi:hypothetical protein